MSSPYRLNSETKHKEMYKAKTPPWRDTYRQRCMERLRTSRDRLISKFRDISLSNDNSISIVTDVMKEEFNEIKKSNHDDEAMDTTTCSGYDDDIDDSILEQIRLELEREEQQMLADILLQEEMMALEAAIRLNNSNGLICPVCRRNFLSQDPTGIIICACGLRLHTEHKSISHLQLLLQDAFGAHTPDCPTQPDFVEGVIENRKHLICMCKVCDYFTIVV